MLQRPTKSNDFRPTLLQERRHPRLQTRTLWHSPLWHDTHPMSKHTHTHTHVFVKEHLQLLPSDLKNLSSRTVVVFTQRERTLTPAPVETIRNAEHRSGGIEVLEEKTNYYHCV